MNVWTNMAFATDEPTKKMRTASILPTMCTLVFATTEKDKYWNFEYVCPKL